MTTLVTTRPDEGITPPWSFPTVQRLSLDGVDVVAAHLPARPLVHATVLVDTGATADPVGKEGTASLLGDVVLRGAAGLDQHGLAVAFESVGAVPSVSVSFERTDLDVEVPAGLLPEALALLAEVLRRPTLAPSELVRVRDARVDRLLARRTDPGFRVGRAAARGLWAPSSRYAISSGGGADQVRTITAEDVAELHAKRWAQAPVTLILVGDLTGVDLAGVAAPLSGTTVAPVPVVTSGEPAGSGTRIHVTDVPGSVQSVLRVMAPGPAFGEADDAALEVASTAVFGSFSSRLNLKLREDLGYTYGASGGFAHLRDVGWSQAGASVRTEVTAASVAETLGVLRAATADGLTEEEVAHARTNLVRKFAVRYDGPGAVASALARRVHNRLEDDERDRHLASLQAVTTDSATAAWRAAMRDQDLVVTVAGAADEVVASLEETGLGPVSLVE